jgi:hypothetical protein
VPALAVLAAAVVAGLAGWLVGAGGDTPDATPPPRPALARGGGVEVVAPPSWKPITRASEPAPAPFRRPVMVGRADDRLLAELLPAQSATLLPEALAGAEARRVRAVDIGGARGLRYDDVGPSGVTILVLPTTRGVATVACDTSAGRAARACVAAARAIRVPGARPLALGRDTAFRMALASVMRDSRAAREAGRRRLAAADGVGPRAQAARAIARDLRRPAARLTGLAASGGATAVVAALEGAAASYDELAAAVEDGDRARHARAITRVAAAERAVDRAARAIATPAP